MDYNKMDLNARAENMRRFFNRKAEGYDDVHLKMMDNKLPLVENLPENTRRVLDLGAGTGLELFALFDRFPDARVTVVDVSENMLDQLRERPFADRLDIICGDFFLVDFGKDYDAVISTSALHHFTEADKTRLCAKALNSLRPGGLFINSDKISEDQAAQDYAFKELAEEPDKYAHMDTPLTMENERKVLQQAGYANVTVKRIQNTNYALSLAQKPE